MRLLQFPTDRIGTVEWVGSWSDDQGPVLATGSVQVPDDVDVRLEIQSVLDSKRTDGDNWLTTNSLEPIDLEFLRGLPPDGIESLSIRRAVETSFDAIEHLAPGLRKLYLVWPGLGDAVLAVVAKLTGLTWLQSFGNKFTDAGIQQLATLVNLDCLYLEEETLSLAAFDFVDQLPHLTTLGLQDVPLSPSEIDELRRGALRGFRTFIASTGRTMPRLWRRCGAAARTSCSYRHRPSRAACDARESHW